MQSAAKPQVVVNEKTAPQCDAQPPTTSEDSIKTLLDPLSGVSLDEPKLTDSANAKLSESLTQLQSPTKSDAKTSESPHLSAKMVNAAFEPTWVPKAGVTEHLEESTEFTPTADPTVIRVAESVRTEPASTARECWSLAQDAPSGRVPRDAVHAALFVPRGYAPLDFAQLPNVHLFRFSATPVTPRGYYRGLCGRQPLVAENEGGC